MYLRGNMSRAYAILGLSTLLFLGLYAHAQSRTPTPEELRQLQAFGIDPAMVRNVDLHVLYGGCDFNPYIVLDSRFKAGNNVQITPRADGSTANMREGINPDLACRLVKFLQYAESRGCQLRINSAYRSAQHQASLCGEGRTGCAPPGRSCHQYGLAVDIVGSNQCISWARNFLGSKNPNTEGARQFQLHFPYSGNHIQCSENVGASCNPGTPQCGGNSRITADLAHRPSPSAAFSNTLRQWLAPQPAPMIPAQSAIPSQPISMSQSPIQAFQEPQALPSAPGVSSQIDTTGGTTHTTSTVADRLEELAFGPAPTTSTTTATSVPIVVSAGEAAVITSAQQQGGQQQQLPSGVSGISESTFISGDLSWQGSSAAPSQPVTGWDAIFVTMRATLNRIAHYLVPFGARDGMHFDEHGDFDAIE